MNRYHCCSRDISPEHRLIDTYICVGRLHRAVLERDLSKTGVYRSQHQLLMYIAENPDLSQKEIAHLNHVSSATVAVSLKKLEKGGYICRAVDQSDNRCNRLQVTEKGAALVEDSKLYFRKVEQTMFAGFSKEEKEGLQAYLERILENLNHMMPEEEREEHT